MPIPPILSAALALSALVASAASERPRDQNGAFQDAQAGKIMPLRRLEARVREHPVARGATYLGPHYNEASATYRLKFMRGGRVIWVDADARTGRVIGTSGD